MNNCCSSNLDRHLHIGVLLISATVYEFTSSQDTKMELKDLTHICRNLVRLAEIFSRISPCTSWSESLLREEESLETYCIFCEGGKTRCDSADVCRYMNKQLPFKLSKTDGLIWFQCQMSFPGLATPNRSFTKNKGRIIKAISFL